MLLSPNIHFLQRGWFNSNSILLTSQNGVVIVDTGHRDEANELLCLIQQAGINPADICLIVNTHCHWDHHGGNAAIQAISGATVGLGAKTAELFSHNCQREMWSGYFGVEMNPVTADFLLYPGETVELAGLPFEIISTPGHAPDAISLYQPNHHLLICADVLLEGGDCGVLNTAVHGPAALDAAIQTVETLQQYEISLTLPGHGPLITDTPDNLQALSRRLQRFRRDPAQIAWHLVRRVMMTYLMSHHPVTLTDFVTTISHTSWLDDYMPACGFTTPTDFVAHLVGEFTQRGLVQVENGLLTSLVTR